MGRVGSAPAARSWRLALTETTRGVRSVCVRLCADMNRTNVPNIRLAFREEVLAAERRLVLGEGFDASQNLPDIHMDPSVHVEDVVPALFALSTEPSSHPPRLVEVVNAVIGAQHSGAEITTAAAAAETAISPATSATSSEAMLEGMPTAMLSPPTLVGGAAGVTGTGAGGAISPSAVAAAKRRYSVLTSIGLLGATQRRRVTANDDVAAAARTEGPARADSDGPAGPMAS